jgi:C-mannosyltransferase DPY19L
LYENQTKFSHLSSLERELSLSPHEAFFYQFYKRILDANTFDEGINSLIADNITEYNEGVSINSLRRFHILPEVIIAFLYRNFMLLAQSLSIPTVNCYYVEPDENSKVDSTKLFVNCEGLGEPIFFYLAITWSLSAITIFLLYMYGYFLHRNFIAGCAAIVYYFCVHETATNVHRMPMMRNNFAVPFIIWQTSTCTWIGMSLSTTTGLMGVIIEIMLWYLIFNFFFAQIFYLIIFFL